MLNISVRRAVKSIILRRAEATAPVNSNSWMSSPMLTFFLTTGVFGGLLIDYGSYNVRCDKIKNGSLPIGDKGSGIFFRLNSPSDTELRSRRPLKSDMIRFRLGNMEEIADLLTRALNLPRLVPTTNPTTREVSLQLQKQNSTNIVPVLNEHGALDTATLEAASKGHQFPQYLSLASSLDPKLLSASIRNLSNKNPRVCIEECILPKFISFSSSSPSAPTYSSLSASLSSLIKDSVMITVSPSVAPGIHVHYLPSLTSFVLNFVGGLHQSHPLANLENADFYDTNDDELGIKMIDDIGNIVFLSSSILFSHMFEDESENNQKIRNFNYSSLSIKLKRVSLLSRKSTYKYVVLENDGPDCQLVELSALLNSSFSSKTSSLRFCSKHEISDSKQVVGKIIILNDESKLTELSATSVPVLVVTKRLSCNHAAPSSSTRVYTIQDIVEDEFERAGEELLKGLSVVEVQAKLDVDLKKCLVLYGK